MKCSVVIPAGGLGKRFGGNIPKQYLEFAGKPILMQTINLFESMEEIDSIIVSVHTEWYTRTNEMIKQYGFKKVKELVIGGVERQDSVNNALHTQSVEESDVVLVHDAVRPLVTPKLIRKVIEVAEEFGAAIPYIRPKDTIKEITAREIVVKTIDRSKLVMVQTPQGFWPDILKNAYEKAKAANYIGTDSAQLLEFIGYKVAVVPGEDENIKITTPLDIRFANMIMEERLK